MTHAPHTEDEVRIVLGDNCDECIARSKDLNGMSQIDTGNLRKLAELAKEIHDFQGTLRRPQELGASYTDRNAVETLRLMARIVFRSGITEKVAE